MLGSARVTYGTMACIAAIVALAIAPAPAAADPGCGAQPGAAKADPKPTTQGPAPQYVCEKPNVDFGEIWEGKSLSVSWVIKNTGAGDLNIKLKGG